MTVQDAYDRAKAANRVLAESAPSPETAAYGLIRAINNGVPYPWGADPAFRAALARAARSYWGCGCEKKTSERSDT